jgi:hypothetical protein
MNHVTADDSLRDLLRDLQEPVEIRDAQGQLLGHFTPHISPERKALYERARQLFDLDEARRISAIEREGSSLAEVWKRIHARESQQ